MRLPGINQQLLLNRAKCKGYLTLKDYAEITNHSITRRNLKRSMAQMEKLEYLGYIKRGQHTWKLTKIGLEVLQECNKRQGGWHGKGK